MTERSPLWLHKHLSEVWANPPGWGRFAAVNHTIVGKRFMVTAFAFFAIGGLLAMLMRTQLAVPGHDFLTPGTYNQIFTMHGTVMMFLFAIPMIEGLAMYLLPKMLGARDLAFPRLSSFGYWCYLFGGAIIIAALVLGVAPDSGWFMYTPLSGSTYSPGINADVWLIGVTFVEISAICAAVEFVASILTMRAAGMALSRMPIFAWYMLVTAVMMLVGFPPLILGSIILELERAFGWPFFDAARGGDPLLWQHLFWMFGHPEVYIIFLPGAGIVSTLIPVFARRPLVGYTAIVASVIAVGFISFGLWVHHMFTVGIPHMAQAFFSAASMLVAIPTAVQFFAWIATLWAGKPVLKVPMLYLFGFLVIFVAGGLTGVMLALVPFDWQVHDTHFVVAHMHYVLIGGLIFPLMAGAYYWLPHMTGRMPSERLGQWAFWLIFIGFNVTFLIMHLTGLLGMPRRVYTYGAGLGWDVPNLVSSIGGFIMSAGFVLLVMDLFLHKQLGHRPTRNPWNAGTLEWAMPIPPTIYNFASVPRVAERDPLWEEPKLHAGIASGAHFLSEAHKDRQKTVGVDVITGEPTHAVVLPRPSFLPLAAGVLMAAFCLSLLFKLYWLAPIVAVAVTGVFLRWIWSSSLDDDIEPVNAGHGLELPLHHVVRAAPGWWGAAGTLVADGTLFASLLFGYLYLWTVAPNWPPLELIGGHPLIAGAMIMLVLAGYGAARLALDANARGNTVQLTISLAIGLVTGVLAAGGLLAAALVVFPDPTLHAYGAATMALAGYAIFHGAVAAIISGYALARVRFLRVPAARTLDLRVHRLWWGYTAATTVIAVLAIFAFPGAMTP